MTDLPTIVARIHEQRPGIELPKMDFFPGVPGAVAPAWRITVGRESFYVPHFAAIAIVEAALWRWLRNSSEWSGRVVVWSRGQWVVAEIGFDDLGFGSDPLSLIRALCHAAGVELEREDAK